MFIEKTGYRAGDTYHYYLRDYQGNNRVRLTSAGEQKEWNAYYPYGGAFGDICQRSDLYRYSGKELDKISGLDWYDFSARHLDPAYCRFTTPDPLAEQYPHLSPYAYCANNPLTYVDPDGRDIVVLINSDGASGLGHMAILIQDKKGVWHLWSKNGTEDSFGFKVKEKSPGGESDQKEYGYYRSPVDFLNGSDNIEKGTNEHIYNEGYLIETTPSEDVRAINAANKNMEDPYHLLSSNCAQLVQKTLKAAGKNDGAILGDNDIPYKPNEIYKRIKDENEGTIVKPQEN